MSLTQPPEGQTEWMVVSSFKAPAELLRALKVDARRMGESQGAYIRAAVLERRARLNGGDDGGGGSG